MVKLFLLILLSIFFLMHTCVYAGKNERWVNLTVNEGLIDNYVECLLEDKDGFLWIGTWSGISRFDGKEFKHYRKGVSDSLSLPGNWIYCIYQDRLGTIWAGTDEGLAVYNPKLNIFQAVKGVGSHSIVSIKEDNLGNIWVGGDNKLYQINSITHQLLFLKIFKIDSNHFIEIGPIAIDKEDTIWIGTSNQGIIKFSIKTKLVSGFSKPTRLSSVINDHIKYIDINLDGSVWVGTMNQGLFHWIPEDNSLINFKHQSTNIQSLADNRVESMYKDRQEQYYIISPNGYINRLSLPENNFERIEIDQQLIHSDVRVSTSCFLVDRNGNEWIGTHGNGLLNRNRQKEKFLNIAISGTRALGNKVASFLCLPDGRILVGTDGGGLKIFDQNTLSFSSVDLGHSLKKSKILSMAYNGENEIWLSFWANGIASLDTKTLRLKQHYLGNKKNTPNLSSSDIKKVMIENSTLWIVSSGDGIFQYDLITQKFINRNSSDVPFDFRIPKWGNSIFKDSKNRIWISTSKGLFMYDGKALKHFLRNIENRESIISNLIMSVFEDSKNRIWIITDAGLELYEEKKQGFIHFNTFYEIPRQLKGIIEDKQGRLWLSSNEGITCLDIDSKKVTQFTIENGLPSNFFYHQSVASTGNGYLIFGSLDGFTYFHPDSLSVSHHVSKAEFTDFQINYVSQVPSPGGIINEHIQSSKNINIDYSSDILTFIFTSVDLCNAQNIRYSYFLSGLGNSWVNIGKQNSVSFSNLAPGNYELKILAKNINGITAKESTSIYIHVLPPWYLTRWAYLGYLLSVVLSLYLLYYFLRLRFKTRNALLMKEFEYQKELELYQSKINFFTSISHDIRTPLTLIMAPLELLREKISSNQEAMRIVRIMEKNAHDLLGLMNELLEFKNLESGIRPLRLEVINIKEIIENVIESFGNEIVVRNVLLTTNLIDCDARVDSHLMKKVIHNLLINAFKFTPKDGTIELTLQKISNSIELSIYNSGYFVSEDLQAKIFDPYYTSKNEKGHGLGLAIVKEIVLIHHGKIEVKNNINGVVFKIILPEMMPS